jgi:hypothetical protein
VSTTSRRGLSGGPVVVLALLVGLAGAAYDLLTRPGLGVVFAACFVAGCVLAALVARRTSLAVVAVMPPLVYVVLALVAGLATSTGAAGSFIVRQGLSLFTTLVLQAPALLLGTGLAVVIALLRGLGRTPRTPQPPAPSQQEQLAPLVY